MVLPWPLATITFTPASRVADRRCGEVRGTYEGAGRKAGSGFVVLYSGSPPNTRPS